MTEANITTIDSVASQPAPRPKRGRPFVYRDLSDLIGQTFGKLTIRGRDAQCPGGHVLCTCDCGGTCRPQLRMVLSGRTVSCGCVRRAHFRGYWDRRAEKLPMAWRRRIFTALCSGRYDAGVAYEYGMQTEMVSAIGRIHSRYLMSTYAETYRRDSHDPSLARLTRAERAYLAKWTSPSESTFSIAAGDSTDLYALLSAAA